MVNSLIDFKTQKDEDIYPNENVSCDNINNRSASEVNINSIKQEEMDMETETERMMSPNTNIKIKIKIERETLPIDQTDQIDETEQIQCIKTEEIERKEQKEEEEYQHLGKSNYPTLVTSLSSHPVPFLEEQFIIKNEDEDDKKQYKKRAKITIERKDKQQQEQEHEQKNNNVFRDSIVTTVNCNWDNLCSFNSCKENHSSISTRAVIKNLVLENGIIFVSKIGLLI